MYDKGKVPSPRKDQGKHETKITHGNNYFNDILSFGHPVDVDNVGSGT